MTRRELPPHCYAKPGGVWFQRRGWQTVRFEAAPGTPEFAAEYARILRGQDTTPPAKRSFTALIASYQRSPRWKALQPRTQADYRKVLDWAKAKLGPLPADRMQRKDVIRAQTANADTVRFANYIVQVLRVLMEHAIDLGWRQDNPAKGVRMLKTPTEKQAQRQPWPPMLIAEFRAKIPATDVARVVLELAYGIGQRGGDVSLLRWEDYDGEVIRLAQGKTGAALTIPAPLDLRAALATWRGTLPDILPARATICCKPTGKPYNKRTLDQKFLAARRKVGADDYDLHSLRYTVAAEIAAAGGSDEQIASVTGHATAAMVAKYAGPARQKARAVEAQGRRE